MAKQVHPQPEGLRLEIDLDNFELDDWEILDGSKAGTKMANILDVLDRLVVGGVRGKGYKGMDLVNIQKAVLDQVLAEANPSQNGKN